MLYYFQFFIEQDCILNNESLFNINFPKFFTPNNDGTNDFWNVYGISEKVRKESIIKIFDRYGKQIIAFKPYNSNGWDGTYNGNPCQSSDYWFVFYSDSGYQKVGHFTLKR